MKMKEELTTLMHMEFAQDEDERIELAAHGVFDTVFLYKKATMSEACKKYGISEETFWENAPYKHVFSFAETPLETLQKKWNHTKEKDIRYKACKTKEEMYEVFVSYW